MRLRFFILLPRAKKTRARIRATGVLAKNETRMPVADSPVIDSASSRAPRRRSSHDSYKINQWSTVLKSLEGKDSLVRTHKHLPPKHPLQWLQTHNAATPAHHRGRLRYTSHVVQQYTLACLLTFLNAAGGACDLQDAARCSEVCKEEE